MKLADKPFVGHSVLSLTEKGIRMYIKFAILLTLAFQCQFALARDIELEEIQSQITVEIYDAEEQLTGSEARALDPSHSALETTTQKKRGILSAWKAYRKLKRQHPEKFAEIKRRHKELKKALKDPQSNLRSAIDIVKNACRTDKAACLSAQKSILFPVISAQFSEQRVSWIDLMIANAQASEFEGGGFACSSSADEGTDDGLPFHALIFGEQNLKCEGGFDVSIGTIGPGLSVAASAFVFGACVLPGNGENLGVFAGALAGAGVEAGLFFGSNGICTVLGIQAVGIGGFAGLSVLSFDESHWGHR